MDEKKMVRKKEWKEFREIGLLWWVNTMLHMFGWSIVCEVEGDKVIDVYPARVSFRGFSNELNTEGYIKVSDYLSKESKTLLKESKDE